MESATPQTPQTLPMVLPYWPPQTPQTPRTLPMVLPYWPLETLQNLALAGLWALGSVRGPLETLQNLALARLWALGSVSATRGGSFWARISLGKAVAGSGVRGQDERDKWGQERKK